MTGIHVLVVDDNDDLREILVLILEESGFRASQAADGRQAVDAAHLDRPDVIVMDIFMPIMDGIQATRMIRADAELSHIPVIAQTARAAPFDDEDDLFIEVLTKPCDPETVMSAIRRAHRRVAGREV
jgi:CheY-like chemotaxis protein